MIADVKITPLKIISDDRGKVMHMLRKDSAIFDKFGEIYFSTIYHKSIKAWHLHKESALNYACIKGKVKLVLFDNRDGSSSKGNFQELILSPKNYFFFILINGDKMGLNYIDFKKHFFRNLIYPTLGYQYFILFSEKLLQYSNLKDKRII